MTRQKLEMFAVAIILRANLRKMDLLVHAASTNIVVMVVLRFQLMKKKQPLGSVWEFQNNEEVPWIQSTTFHAVKLGSLR